jgi:hypothetical protein
VAHPLDETISQQAERTAASSSTIRTDIKIQISSDIVEKGVVVSILGNAASYKQQFAVFA